MSAEKPTGNWRAYESAAGFPGEWGVETDEPSMVADGDEIIVYPSLCREHAHLIAEAPNMLDELKAAESFMSGFEGDALQDGIDDRLTAIRSAIARAEGRS